MLGGRVGGKLGVEFRGIGLGVLWKGHCGRGTMEGVLKGVISTGDIDGG